MKWILTNIKIIIYFFGKFCDFKEFTFLKTKYLTRKYLNTKSKRRKEIHAWEVTVIFSEEKPTDSHLNSVVGYCSMLFEIWVR